MKIILYFLFIILNCKNIRNNNQEVTRSISDDFLWLHIKDKHFEDSEYAYVTIFWSLPYKDSSDIIIFEKIEDEEVILNVLNTNNIYNEYVYKFKKDELKHTIGVRWKKKEPLVQFYINSSNELNIFEER